MRENPSRKRDIIKKVIAYMTLGIDVSRLFTEMMLAIETRWVLDCFVVLRSRLLGTITDYSSAVAFDSRLLALAAIHSILQRLGD